MKERPILFAEPMVRAILEGRKTQSRRLAKKAVRHPDLGNLYAPGALVLEHEPQHVIDRCCPYGRPGDRLWVRETWRVGEDVGAGWTPESGYGDLHLIYDADGARDYRSFPDEYAWPRRYTTVHNDVGTPEHWISRGPFPSIHMPRWASRILLEITAVRVERLQDISGADALAEGVNVSPDHHSKPSSSIYSPVQAYRDLWDRINGPGSWDANPWVWVIEFRRIA